MACQWTPELSVGVSSIDRQHQELFTRLNALLDGMRKGNAARQVRAMATFLAEYVIEHFAAEEQYMAAYSYPGTNNHKLQHRMFIRDFAALKSELSGEEIPPTMVLKMHRTISEWLVDHITRTDQVLGAFLKQHMAAPAMASL